MDPKFLMLQYDHANDRLICFTDTPRENMVGYRQGTTVFLEDGDTGEAIGFYVEAFAEHLMNPEEWGLNAKLVALAWESGNPPPQRVQEYVRAMRATYGDKYTRIHGNDADDAMLDLTEAQEEEDSDTLKRVREFFVEGSGE